MQVNIVFLSYLVPPENSYLYGGISIAGNKMQYNIARELGKIENVNVKVLSLEPHACYPSDKKIFIRKKNSIYENFMLTNVPFINLPVIKQITQIYFMKKYLRRTLRSIKGKTIVLGFNMFPQIGNVLNMASRMNYETICILADLPIDDSTKRGFFSKCLRYIFDRNTKLNIKKCHNFMVLSKYVYLDYLKDKRCIVIEGGVDSSDISKFSSYKRNEPNVKNIVFGGTLNEYNGIKNLIGSMKYLPHYVELHIYGDGELREYVINEASVDSRIKYYGRISNDEMLKVQQNAFILINPRQVNNTISKYTFPSKTFEYLLSKRIVVTTNIPSYPKEYLRHMIVADDSSYEISQAIFKVLKMTEEERNRIASDAYRFISNEKMWENQIHKFYVFIEEIINGK